MPPARMLNQSLESLSFLDKLTIWLTNPFKNWLLPTSHIQRRMRASRSPLVQEFFQRPGGWRAMEIIYQCAPPVDWIDKLALKKHPVAMDARNRRQVVVSILHDWINHARGDGPCEILGVGTGPARELLDAIPADRKNQVSITAVDLDSSAFEVGRAAAAELGLADSIRFIECDACTLAHRMPDVKFRIAALIGIIEYLGDEELLKLFRSIHAAMDDRGQLLTHGFQDPYHTQPFFRRVFGMELRQRTATDVVALLEQAGFTAECTCITPMRTYPMMVAVKR